MMPQVRLNGRVLSDSMKIRSLALAALLVMSCAGERRLSSAECAGICGRVVNEENGQPVTRFTVALFAAETRRPRQAVRLPEGYPVPPGPLVETFEVESAEGILTIDHVPAGGVYLGIAAPGFAPHETDVLRAGGARIVINLRSTRPPSPP